MARQPMVNHIKDVVGYELLFRSHVTSQSAENIDLDAASAQVMANALTTMGVNWLEGRPAYINVSFTVLKNNIAEVLPPDLYVLEIDANSQAKEETLEIIKKLRGSGYKICLDDYEPGPQTEQYLPFIHAIKVDLSKGAATLVNAIKSIQGTKIIPCVKKIEEENQWNVCSQLGYHYFQGYYFSRPETVTAKSVHPSYEVILSLLNLVKKDADGKKLEDWFKRDPALSFKLFRYINSAGFGFSEIQSIRHAVTMLGLKQLYRWLTLLLITASTDTASPVLIKAAAIRGRVTELLGQAMLPPSETDNLFVVGMFSMLDIILGLPITDIIDRLGFSDSMKEALLTRSGMYGCFVAIAEALEKDDLETLNRLSAESMIDAATINKAHLDAVAWVERLGL